MVLFQLGFRSVTRITGSAFTHLQKISFNSQQVRSGSSQIGPPPVKKPHLCTADELHFVTLPHSDWKLALWRYLPSPKAKSRNHPLLLLSGVGNNAAAYDLSTELSFARFMAGNGFDTWTLEVRGSGLSTPGPDNDPAISSIEGETTEMVPTKKSQSKFSQTLIDLSKRMSDFFDEGQHYAIARQIRNFSKRILDTFEEGQQTLNRQSSGFQENLRTSLHGFMNQLDLLVKYDWDFDEYLERDLPEVMEYIKTHSKPRDGKLLAIGHSMGGIILYATLSRCDEVISQGFEGRDSMLASVVTLGSSLDYSSSKSALKLLLPVVDPARFLNVPAIPMGTLLSAIHTFALRPPYIRSWFNRYISAPGMMHPDLLENLVSKNFCTVPTKLLLQLATAFEEGGLRERSGTFFYKAHLGKCNVPVLALAGDEDLICPPDAVYETIKVIPRELVTCRTFGEASGPHYGHYDLIGSRLPVSEVFPCIVNFLDRHDSLT